MAIKSIVLALTLVLSACLAGTECSQPPGESIFYVRQAPPEPEFYTVRVEFGIKKSDQEKYPELVGKFLEAVEAWVSVIPIEAAIFFQDEHVDLDDYRPDIIDVVFSEHAFLGDTEENNKLATFSYTTKKITVDVNDFKVGDVWFVQKALAVFKHELGHLFGITHIANRGDFEAGAGDITIASGAEKYIMYYRSGANNVNSPLSELEIGIATRYVLTRLPLYLSGADR